jgi:hypothetical protein
MTTAYQINGLDCAACGAKIEDAVRKLPDRPFAQSLLWLVVGGSPGGSRPGVFSHPGRPRGMARGSRWRNLLLWRKRLLLMTEIEIDADSQSWNVRPSIDFDQSRSGRKNAHPFVLVTDTSHFFVTRTSRMSGPVFRSTSMVLKWMMIEGNVSPVARRLNDNSRFHFKPIFQFHSPGRFLMLTPDGTGSSR